MKLEVEHLGSNVFRIETPQYLQKKMEDHRSFSVVMSLLATILGPSLWLWDYVTDPVGARNTVGLRLLYLFWIVLPLAFKHLKNRHWLAATAMGAVFFGEWVFLEILTRLDQGMTYGSGGFLIFMYSPLLLFTGFSLRLNLGFLFLAAALPQVLAAAGFAPGFQHSHYAVLIWPTVVTLMLVQFAFSHNYWRRYQSEAALKLESDSDPMTGLSNRRHFFPLLRHETVRAHRLGRRLSLLMLDIDHFKKINDSFGHPTGDVVICTLADICHKVSRQIDVVARLGGDEFAILLPEASQQDARALAERIRSTVEFTPMHSLNGVVFHFTVSIGVAEQAPELTSEGQLVEMADAALYQAKTAGRNRLSEC